MLPILFLIINIVFIVLTVLPIYRSPVWWIRGLDFPRLQLLVIFLITLTLEIFLLDFSETHTGLLIAITGLCLAYQAWWIIPYTKLFPVEVKPPQSICEQEKIKIITANVLMTNHNSAELIKLIHENQPDIFVTLESDIWWETQMSSLENDYRYTIKCPLDNFYGMHVYSKLPLKNCQISYLVEPDKPSMHTLVVLPSGDEIRIHFLHPAPPSPTENSESTERDAELIIVAKSVVDSDLPVIVTGDLNDVAWSWTTRLFRKISGLLDPRVGRGIFNTFHANFWFLRWPLDHLFHSDDFTINKIIRLRSFGSDHFALLTELVLEEKHNKPEQEGLSAEADDISMAEEIADEMNVTKNDVPQPDK